MHRKVASPAAHGAPCTSSESTRAGRWSSAARSVVVGPITPPQSPADREPGPGAFTKTLAFSGTWRSAAAPCWAAAGSLALFAQLEFVRLLGLSEGIFNVLVRIGNEV